MRGYENGSLFSDFEDEIANFCNLVGIETCGGLVEDEDVGFMQDCLSESDALAIAARERIDRFVHDGEDGADGGGIENARVAIGTRNAALFGDGEEGIGDDHIVVEWVIFGEVTEVLPNFHGILCDIEAGDADDAGGWPQERRQDFHGRRFTGAIWSNECDDFAGVESE